MPLTTATKDLDKSTILQKLESGALEIDKEYEYESDYIELLLDLKIKHKLGGFAPNSRFLLNQNFQIDGKLGYVAVLPVIAVNPLQPDSEHAFTSILDSYINDIFKELSSIISNNEDLNIKLLFPLNYTNSHWYLGEVIIKKTAKSYKVQIFGHNPYGKDHEKTLPENARSIICPILEKHLKNFDINSQISFEIMDSPYNARQQHAPKYNDDIDISKLSSDKAIQLAIERSKKQEQLEKDFLDRSLCGVIVLSDLEKRIKNESLDIAQPYAKGDAALRLNDIKLILNHASEEDCKMFLSRVLKNVSNVGLDQAGTTQIILDTTYNGGSSYSSNSYSTSNPESEKTNKNNTSNYSISYQMMLSIAALIITSVFVAFGAPFITAPYMMPYIIQTMNYLHLSITTSSLWTAELLAETVVLTAGANLVGKAIDYVDTKISFQDRITSEKSSSSARAT